MKNNLFHYATSELSQDAFICWLLSHAMEEYKDKDPGLSGCAQDFLQNFLQDGAEHIVREIKKQEGNIDILVELASNKIIVIEDKTGTSERDKQLQKYKDYVANKYPACQAYFVYFKTGYQSYLGDVTAAGYRVCSREEILNTLNKFEKKTENAIFQDFLARQKHIDEDYKKFTGQAIEWPWDAHYGFFAWLKSDSASPLVRAGYGEGAGYCWINNPTGGFYGLWCGEPDEDGQGCLEISGCRVYIYMQINKKYGEEGQITLRMSIREGCDYWGIREKLTETLKRGAGYNRSARIGRGDSVVFAYYKEKIINFKEASNVIERAVEDYKKILCWLKEG